MRSAEETCHLDDFVGRKARVFCVDSPVEEVRVGIYDARDHLRGVFWLDHDTGHVRSEHKIETFYEDDGVCFERAGVELMVLTTAQLHRLTGVVHAAWPECECNAKYGCDCGRPEFCNRMTGHLPHLFLSDVCTEG